MAVLLVLVILPAGHPAGSQGLGAVALARYSDAGVLCFGHAFCPGSPTEKPVASPVVAMAATVDGRGYWLATAGGGVRAYGDATIHGTALSYQLSAPVVTIARTADGQGYWLLTAGGGVRAFGDATWFGSWSARPLKSPAVELVATPDGRGYWIVNRAGGIRAFGDAQNYGHPNAHHPGGPVEGMASTIDGRGYWIVTADGHLFNFGDAAKLVISTHGRYFTQTVAGIATAPSGSGFWLTGQNGQVQSYGARTPVFGSNAAASPVQPIAAITAAPEGSGYWLLEPDAFTTNFTGVGSTGALGRSIVAVASGQISGDPNGGEFCNPYGPCEPWCALFSTWVWRQAGVAIPQYAFTGYIYNWAAQSTGVLRGDARPAPGDAVLYGTGPESVATSWHVGIVAQVWKLGFIDTIEGDAGPSPNGHFNVVINGPYLPSNSDAFNGMPIYGYAIP